MDEKPFMPPPPPPFLRKQQGEANNSNLNETNKEKASSPKSSFVAENGVQLQQPLNSAQTEQATSLNLTQETGNQNENKNNVQQNNSNFKEQNSEIKPIQSQFGSTKNGGQANQVEGKSSKIRIQKLDTMKIINWSGLAASVVLLIVFVYLFVIL